MAKHTFYRGIDLIRHQQKRFETLKLTRAQGLMEMAKAGARDGIELASGDLTKAQTRGAFARGSSPAKSTATGLRRKLKSSTLTRRGVPGGVPLLPINEQTHRLVEGIRLLPAPSSVGMSYDLVVQGVPYAKYILSDAGTRGKNGKGGMVARGYKKEVKKRQKQRMTAFVQFYVRKQRST